MMFDLEMLEYFVVSHLNKGGHNLDLVYMEMEIFIKVTFSVHMQKDF